MNLADPKISKQRTGSNDNTKQLPIVIERSTHTPTPSLLSPLPPFFFLLEDNRNQIANTIARYLKLSDRSKSIVERLQWKKTKCS